MEKQKYEEWLKKQMKKEKKKLISPVEDDGWKARLDKHGFKINPISPPPSDEQQAPNQPVEIIKQKLTLHPQTKQPTATEIKQQLTAQTQQKVQIKKVVIPPPEPKPEPEPEPVAQEAQSDLYENPKRYLAIYEFTSNDPQELPFNEGDVIWILQQEGDWWWGEKDGVQGFVPANHLEEILEGQQLGEVPDQTVQQQGSYVPEEVVQQQRQQPQEKEYIPAKIVQEQIREEEVYIAPVTKQEPYIEPVEERAPEANQETFIEPTQIVISSALASSGGNIPPAPPLPTGLGITSQTDGVPPPPPPPPLEMPGPRTNIGDLHAAIKQGVKLNNAAKSPGSSPNMAIPQAQQPGRDDLLAKIREGVTLRKASDRVLVEKAPSKEPAKDAAPLNVADILKTKFGNELKSLNYESSSESEDEGSDLEW